MNTQCQEMIRFPVPSHLLLPVLLAACGARTGLTPSSSPECSIPDAATPLAPPTQPEPGGLACTRIGCTDQIAITIRDARGQELTPARWVVGLDGARLSETGCGSDFDLAGSSITCLDGSLRVSFLGASQPLPSVLEVSVTTTTGLHVDACVAPTYRLVQPNGPGCAPICRQARIELIAR